MKRVLLVIIVGLLFSGRLIAQQEILFAEHTFDNNIGKDFQFADYDRKPLDMVNYDKDPSAHALVLKEFGRAWITSNGNTETLMFEYHVKIKLFDNEALKRGHVEIPYYIRDNGSYEEIRTNGVEAITYYKEPDGAMQGSVVNPDSINIVKVNKHLSKIVFNMPNLHPGCIIEYRYRLESPYLEKFRTWEFQADIPKLYSEYEVHIPHVFGYNVSLRGSLKFTRDTSAIEKECFESTNLKSDCTVEDYLMTNIPAFKQEPYMTSPENVISSLHFQLTSYLSINDFAYLNQALHLDVASEWSDVDKLLKYNDNFGSQLNKKNIFKDRMATITSGVTDPLEKAKAVYAYIQKNISFNGVSSIYTDDGIKKALDKHTGNVAEINLALVAALQEAGINAGAILISTRDNGTVNQLYPALSEFNYIIAAANIGDKDYLLDATEPELQFGILPSRCINGQGRAVPLDKPSYWINVITPQTKTDVYVADLTLNEGGKLTGIITHHSKSYSAYEERKLINSFKTPAGYASTIVLPQGLHIESSSIIDLDSLDRPLTEVYKIEGDLQGDTLAAYINGKLNDNPIKSDTRVYDVDMIMPIVSTYTLTLHLPANKTVNTSPADIHSALLNSAGELNTKFETNGNTVTYTHEYQVSKTLYPVVEYNSIKSFFNDISRSEKVELKLNGK